MLSEHIEAALGGSLTVPALEEIARAMWRALGDGLLDWAEAERLDGLIRARQARMGPAESPGGPGGARGTLRSPAALCGALVAALGRSRRPRSPDKQASRDRRLGAVLSGAMPAAVARGHGLTQGQVAVLSVVGREASRGRATCEWPVAKIGALAGVARTTVQEALRLAQTLGLVRVRERRRRGERSETNVVTVTDKTWWGWLKRDPKRVADDPDEDPAGDRAEGGGSETSGPSDTQGLRGKRGHEKVEEPAGGAEKAPRGGATPRPGAPPGAGRPREGPDGGG